MKFEVAKHHQHAELKCPAGRQADVATRSLARQLERAATANKKAGGPLQLIAASFHGPVAAYAEAMGSQAWQMRRTEASAAGIVAGLQHGEVLLPQLLPVDVVKVTLALNCFLWHSACRHA